ncbi:hypothetical protein DVS28_a1080 [Euzebya pacifica]|uniref:CGNR zinc finger domain-containing protein n=1 Tax=Euzebya pacifica TaxID=1608957 RepID=A0A346XU84_9ACTN|nr:CGNR zinc finger domain-containing protein [Euzebya pacifica]AXV05781.1 hypothetical protein DVS28_a1080 [Euzebya pacifica]
MEVPTLVGAPRLLAVVDTQWPEEPDKEEWWVELDDDIGDYQRVDILDGAHGSLDLVYVARPLYEDYPDVADGLRRIGAAVDWPPAAVFSSSEVELVELPHELVFRGFLEVDAEDLNSVLRWCSRYGPLVPQRLYLHAEEVRPVIEPRASSEDPLELQLYAGDEPDLTEHEIEFDEQPDRLGDSPESYEGTYRASAERDLRVAYGTALGQQQAHFRLYQAVVQSWLHLRPDTDLTRAALLLPPRDELAALWEGHGLSVPSTTIELIRSIQRLTNVETVMSPRIEVAPPGAERGGLAFGRPIARILQAMMLQVVDWVAAGVPARRCANETCATWFARQSGRAEYGQHRTKGVLYCSRACARAQAQREYRRRKRDD